jgi:hypothetical protein
MDLTQRAAPPRDGPLRGAGGACDVWHLWCLRCRRLRQPSIDTSRTAPLSALVAIAA